MLRKCRRAVSWSKYLVSSGAEIKEEGEGDWSADMSQLFIGQPEEDESLANLLEKQFTSEVALLFRLRHPNIITFVAACKKPPVFCIITEYLAGGSLRKFLHQQEPYSVPYDLVLKFSLDIACGMQYLHSQGILHRDLKSENLLLGEDMCVKVADFGISCLETQCGSAKGFTGTYRWMAPEMIKEKHHTKKVDVYSFGIVLWELLTALIPFDNMTPEQAAFAVSQKLVFQGLIKLFVKAVDSKSRMYECPPNIWQRYLFFLANGRPYSGIDVLKLFMLSAVQNARPPLDPACPMAFRHLISRCWSSSADKRPHFDEIVSILESYSESFKQDPDFFSSYKPSDDHAF
ncbi:Serine/threonine-protein kinase HT1 [Vitis vinifera]|uniref:Serine/threonine-protein kinase HT1 n=1 Tax=Vitis vinifera TaxID=29760 RepID=A0A438KBQ3_VITVI|nr:Serine/threonine-protein kinase HT1 [Vitis vinifera]